jgi:hypothetical protein
MAITKDQAKADLEKVMSQFETVGAGTENDRAAQLVMQTLGVLERRLGNPTVIQMLYIDNPEASKLLPPTVYEVAQQYIAGTINEAQAREQLQDASRQYDEVFQEMGIKPQGSAALFGRQ